MHQVLSTGQQVYGVCEYVMIDNRVWTMICLVVC